MPIDAALSDAVNRFVDDVTPTMVSVAGRVSGVDAARCRDDVVVEALNITAGFVDADSLHTDDELWSIVAAFGPMHTGQLGSATPEDLRRSGLVDGRSAWLDQPSDCFEILVATDAREGTEHARTYYDRAMAIGHTVASLDTLVSRAELELLDRYRSMLLRRLARARDDRPAGPVDRVAERGAGTGPAVGTDGGPPTGTATDQHPARPLETLLAELDALVGLSAVKHEVRLVTSLIQVQNLRRQRGLPVADGSRHLVFVGNPGTGKTTVARLVAEIYRTLGVVERGHLVETDRSGLVAGFVGQTATRVVSVFDSADGGILLIDEAYSLVRGGENDFGREAIDSIVKQMEDRRDSVVVIVAGYPDEMDALLDSNPGLRSRFPKTIEFPDYTDEELVAIFVQVADKARYRCTDDARTKVATWLAATPRSKGFGNGRLSRNLFEDAIARHALRVVAIDRPSDYQLMTLEAGDLPEVGEGPGHEREQP